MTTKDKAKLGHTAIVIDRRFPIHTYVRKKGMGTITHAALYQKTDVYLFI